MGWGGITVPARPAYVGCLVFPPAGPSSPPPPFEAAQAAFARTPAVTAGRGETISIFFLSRWMRIRRGSVYAGMDRNGRLFDVIGQLAALRRYARSLAGNSPDAEDLVHDALVRAYERRSTFRSGANLRNWLLSIVHNTHVDRKRSATARGRRDEQAALDVETSYPAHQEHSVRLAQVREAFMALPDEQRQALHLVAVEDLSYQEAADTLGIPVGTLMSRVSRARAALRDFETGAKKSSHLKLVGGGND